MNRRSFLQHSTLALAAAGAMPLASGAFAAGAGRRKFSMSLNPGMIGVNANQQQALVYAQEHGFEAVSCMPGGLLDQSPEQLAQLRAQLKAASLSWDSAGLPVEFRQGEERFRGDLHQLEAQARVMQQLGATRMNTWIMPTHDSLSYRENFARHSERLRECAEIAGEHDVRLGLEYVGPKTLMARDKFSFIRTMKEARELIADIDQPNVGLVLDSFHWYCAGDTEDELLALTDQDIVTVDINDARADLSREQQIDGTRELPLASGQIDLKTFMNALITVGYSGPVRAEPFNSELNAMDDPAAVKKTREAMDGAFALVS